MCCCCCCCCPLEPAGATALFFFTPTLPHCLQGLDTGRVSLTAGKCAGHRGFSWSPRLTQNSRHYSFGGEGRKRRGKRGRGGVGTAGEIGGRSVTRGRAQLLRWSRCLDAWVPGNTIHGNGREGGLVKLFFFFAYSRWRGGGGEMELLLSVSYSSPPSNPMQTKVKPVLWNNWLKCKWGFPAVFLMFIHTRVC